MERKTRTPPKPAPSVGSRKLRKWIFISGIKSTEFARRVGCSAPAVTQWGSGVKCPSKRNIEAIQRVTGGAIVFNDWQAFLPVEGAAK
jgi:DNA-binding transcriptional regulator YdaS (Cro superfamily)